MKRTIVLLAAACLLMACEAHSSGTPEGQEAAKTTAPPAPSQAAKAAVPTQKPATLDNSDCMTTGSMEERVTCVGNSTKQSIQNFDGMSGGRASKYLELGKAEKALALAEQALISAGKKEMSENDKDNPGYTDQLASESDKEFRAWLEYRNASCEASAFYDGFTVTSMEDPTIGCRIETTKKRIAELNETRRVITRSQK